VIVLPFPEPGTRVRQALLAMAWVASGDEEAIAKLGGVESLPRPWDPGSCPLELRWEGEVVCRCCRVDQP
jgi:hypothetical protein